MDKKQNAGTQSTIAMILNYSLLTLIALFMASPFLWMLSTSFKEPSTLFRFPPEWIPDPVSTQAYERILRGMSFPQFILNSAKISVFATIGQLLSCSLAAYAFARMEFKGKEALYFLLLATMMIPFQVTMIPVFFIMKFLGWIDTHYALIVPSFFGGAFGTFLLRQFFASIPKDLEDAARIDGCGRFRIYWQIMLPLSKPALATLAVLTFMTYWNDLLGPVIYLSSVEKMTLTVGLASLQTGSTIARYDILMAGAMISLMPILVVYVVAQRWIVRGITMTGLKG